MKTSTITMLALAGMAVTAVGELAIPRGIYKVDQIDEASAKARESGKAMAFVLTDPGTS